MLNQLSIFQISKLINKTKSIPKVYVKYIASKFRRFRFKYLKTIKRINKSNQYNTQQLQNTLKLLTGSSVVKFAPVPLRYKGSYFFYSVAISNAQLIANYVAFELRKRNPFSEIFQDIIEWKFVTNNLRGITISCSGRFRGESRTRTLLRKKGKIPLSCLKSNIDYGYSIAMNRYGSIGIKIWLYYDQYKK